MTRYGSDVVVDLLRDVGDEHVAFNPGATFRGIHDSLAHSASGPEIMLCTHESISVAIAQGYAKTAGAPMAVLLHDVVGLQSAAMAIYNAWCDRTPILCLGGTGPMSKPRRRPWIDWVHTALVQGQQVRDYVKWDDQPADLASVPESFARAWATTRSAPPGPVYLCLDVTIQEDEAPPGFDHGSPGEYPLPTPPGASAGDVATLAGWLREAQLPVLVTDYAGDTETGFASLRELAELLHAPVIDLGARFNFPVEHELNLTGQEAELADADVVVFLDAEDPAGRFAQSPWSTGNPHVVNVSPAHLRLRSWAQDYQPLLRAGDHLSASCEAILPDLVQALRQQPPSPERLTARHRRLTGLRAARLARWRTEAVAADDASTIPPARLAAELAPLLEGERWMLAHGTLDGWEKRLWPFERHRQHIGWHGGGGLGYGAGAAIGAGLALDRETLCLSIQPDGDLLYTPSALWTAARYGVPVLFLMHNNRQYRNTVDHASRVGAERGRGDDRRYAGAGLDGPAVDFGALARSFGVWADGPVSRPADIAAAFEAARAVVRSGRPALVDILTTGS